jgi:capsular exopolysaccharide synthesis family protein
VLLIDGDLRKPKVAEYMGIEGGAGLTNVLINQAELPEVMQRWGRGQLYVLPAGKVPPNPSELLGSAAMETLFGALHEHFDYILVDAPPLLVTDVVVVRKHTDGVLLIAASGSTRRQQLEGAVRTLAAAGGKLLGVIVTMLPTKGPDSYAYGAYGAYGGYGKKQAESALTASTGPQPVPAGRERAAAEGSTEGPLRGRRVRSA